MLQPLYLLMRKVHLVDTPGGTMVALVATAFPFCFWTKKGYCGTIPVALNAAGPVPGLESFPRFETDFGLYLGLKKVMS